MMEKFSQGATWGQWRMDLSLRVLEEELLSKHIMPLIRNIFIKVGKYIPIIENLYLLILFGLLISGKFVFIDKYFYPIIGQSLMFNIFLFLFSLVFNFCMWHQVLIINMTVCLSLELMYTCGLHISEHCHIVFALTTLSIIISFLTTKRDGTFNKKKLSRSVKETHNQNR